MSLLPVGFGSAADDDYEITDSLRLRSSATAYLSRTPASAGNQKTHTFSAWFKRGDLSSSQFLFTAIQSNAANYWQLWIHSTNQIYLSTLPLVSGGTCFITTGLFRDPSAWYHIVLQFDTTNATAADRVKLYINGERVTAFATNNISSISLNADGYLNSAVEHNIGNRQPYTNNPYDGYITEVNFIDGQALAPTDFGKFDANGTWKAKRYTGTYGTNGFYLPMKPTTQAELQNTVLYTGTGASQSIDGCGYAPDFVWLKSRNAAYSNALFDSIRGTSKWLTSNGTNAEATVSGVASFDSDGFTLGADTGQNNSGTTYVAWTWDAGDNQPSTGHSSLLYTGSGAAQSIKGFGFSPDLIIFRNRAAASPLLIDSVRGAHQELQPNSTGAETSNSGTRIASIDADGFSLANTAVGGLNASGNEYVAWGWDAGDGDPVSNTDGSITSTVKANDATGVSIVSWEGSSATATVGHGLSTAPKVIIAKNRDASTEWPVYHDSVNSGGGSYLRLNGTYANTSSSIIWTGSPTSSVINVGSYSYVNSNSMIAYCFSEVSGVSKFSTYTGTGSSGKAITGLGFRPGFLMIKETSSTGNWAIVDGTRSPFGEVTGDYLYVNLSQAEGGGSAPLQFDSDGFTINSGDSDTNSSGQTYVYMAFKGSYSDHVSPLNDDGSIDSRVKANTSKGFSIVSYEGTPNGTVGHGLSTAPKVIIHKDRDYSVNWRVFHYLMSGSEDYNPTDNLHLNTTNAYPPGVGAASRINGVTSSTFTSTGGFTGSEQIAYCFSEVAGYSKFASYTGNGSTTGPTITTGFRPGFVMVKSSTNSSTDWLILDGTRSPNNTRNKVLFANLGNAEAGTGYGDMDVSDTGFQIKTNGASSNASGQTYIYMAFAETADAVFNFDASGNKNNFDANNINSNAESESTYDLMKDTPSLVDENAANFATLNPLDIYPGRQFAVDGNLKWNDTSGGSWGRSNISVTSGKWYWEVSGFSTTNWFIGVSDGTKSITNYYAYYVGAPTALVYLINGNTYIAGSNASFVSAFATTDVVGFGLDADAGSLAVYKNNVLQGTITGLSYGSYSPMVAPPAAGNCVYNFGQRPLAYTPPTGFLKINTFNLPDSTIEDGSDYFNTVLYTGDNASGRNIPTGFPGGWTWIKNRNAANSHTLSDIVRGDGKTLFTNATNAEVDYGSNGIDFVSDGFDVTHNATNNLFNVSGRTYVSWNWKANGSGVSNTAGDVNSTVSVNTTAGFSIATATTVSSYGSFPFTIGHGLGTAPAMVIYKSRTSSGQNWWVWHKDLPNAATGRGILLNSTGAEVNGGYFASNPATATTMGINSAALINDNVVMYSFAEVEGYSSFGSYTGNGNAEGPFVYTGFKPAFVVTKRNGSSGWPMHDDKRSPYNVTEASLYANAADAEVNPSTEDIDFLSNGFKMRGTTTARNSSGSTYIYIAFAENPFKNSNAR
jgi:hypothetical protein